jgi:magnesium chelatase family protein
MLSKKVAIASPQLKKQWLRYARQKITINMAPADLRKEGSAYDLTLIGILVASQQITAVDLEKYVIMGRLLDGSLQPIRGALPIAIKAKERV